MAKGLFPRAWVKKSFYFQVRQLAVYLDVCVCVCVCFEGEAEACGINHTRLTAGGKRAFPRFYKT